MATLKDGRPENVTEDGEVIDADTIAAESIGSLERYKADITSALAEILEANMAGTLTARDLPRVKIPTGGVTSWIYPTLEGEESRPFVEGVIVGFAANRAYWSHALGDGDSFPDCWSDDGVTGSNPEVHASCECRTCPYSRWGSAADLKGRDTRAQACREFRVVLLLERGKILPTVVRLAPTSIGALRSYMGALSQAGLSSRQVVTRIGLVRQSDGPLAWSVATFTKAADLTGSEATATKAYGRLVAGKVDTASLLAETPELEMAGTR